MTLETQNRIESLILYSIRVLQERVTNDPELHAHNLKEWYGVAIDPDAIGYELEDIAESINSSDREILAL